MLGVVVGPLRVVVLAGLVIVEGHQRRGFLLGAEVVVRWVAEFNEVTFRIDFYFKKIGSESRFVVRGAAEKQQGGYGVQPGFPHDVVIFTVLDKFFGSVFLSAQFLVQSSKNQPLQYSFPVGVSGMGLL